jgi:hypothetical protein
MFTNRKKLNELTVPEFANRHKDLLVIVCDPKTDNMFVGYGGAMVSGKIKSATGEKLHVVKDMLAHSQFKKNINPFLTGIMEIMQLPLKAGNLFYQFLDGAIFNISKVLVKHPKGIPSPFVNKQGQPLTDNVNDKI